MPKEVVKKRAQADARAGKKPGIQAGEFVKEQIHEFKRGKGSAKSRRQAIAIGLSEARREGVKLPAPKRGRVSPATRKKARRDRAVGAGRVKPSRTRSLAAKKAANTRRRQGGGRG